MGYNRDRDWTQVLLCRRFLAEDELAMTPKRSCTCCGGGVLLGCSQQGIL